MYSQLGWPIESWGSESCQSSRLVFGPSRLIYGISRLVSWPSRLILDLTIFFSEFVSRFELDSGFLYFEAVIVRIDEVFFKTKRVLWFINNPLGWPSI